MVKAPWYLLLVLVVLSTAGFYGFLKLFMPTPALWVVLFWAAFATGLYGYINEAPRDNIPMVFIIITAAAEVYGLYYLISLAVPTWPLLTRIVTQAALMYVHVKWVDHVYKHAEKTISYEQLYEQIINGGR